MCCVSLHVVLAQVTGRTQLVVDYVLYHHILITELLDNDFSVLRVRVYATDIVVRNPNRIVAVLGINREIPRAGLVPVHCHVNARRNGCGNLVKDFLNGFVNKLLLTVESFLKERLLVLCVELVYPSCEDGEQQDD